MPSPRSDTTAHPVPVRARVITALPHTDLPEDTDDHARARGRVKRGDGAVSVELSEVSASVPAGVVYTKEDLTRVVGWAMQRGLWILSDEIYEKILHIVSLFFVVPHNFPSPLSQ